MIRESSWSSDSSSVITGSSSWTGAGVAIDGVDTDTISSVLAVFTATVVDPSPECV